jgi:RNA polymerase sigma-70 factor (ECF subfamily)
MNDPDQADDAAQQAFINCFQHLNAYRGGSFRSWLLRIATHACYDALRALRRRPTVPLFPMDANGQEMESPPWIADPRPSPQAQSESDELAHALYRRLDQLPAAFRAVITLVDLYGIGYEEAAHALHIPLGTVKSRLARARLQLREALSVELGLPTGHKYMRAAASG